MRLHRETWICAYGFGIEIDSGPVCRRSFRSLILPPDREIGHDPSTCGSRRKMRPVVYVCWEKRSGSEQRSWWPTRKDPVLGGGQ
jgi:hypothetical protein